jgi:putative hydrolase of the HAD superfamily
VPITTLFIDLDDTLYPASSGLWTALRARIGSYMVERLGIPQEQADKLRQQYFEQYGTALRGLEINYPLDRQDFLAYVHNVDLRAYIHADPAVRAALRAVPARKFVLTNADTNHANRVLAVLELTDCFEGVIDTNALYPHCKPEPAAFERALALAGERDPHQCVMIDDLPRTVRAARVFGMFAILFGPASMEKEADADAVLDDWRKLGEVLRDLK